MRILKKPRGRQRSHAFDVVRHDDTSLEQYFEQTEGMVRFSEATLLYNLAREVQEGCIVEVGSYRGRSTVSLGRGSIDGHGVAVFAIDPHEEFVGVNGGSFGAADRGAFFQAMLDTSCFHVVRLINLSSETIAPNWDQKIGLLWIDGDHSYEGVRRDFECWSPHLLPGAPIAFDDTKDKSLGPHKFITELLATGEYKKVNVTGKVTVVQELNA